MDKRSKNTIAAYLLYAASAIGLINLYAAASITHVYTPLIHVDIVAYVVLAVIAVLVHIGLPIVRWVYLILAIVWYVALVCYLPYKYHHSLDIYTVFTQVALTVAAYFLMWSKQTDK